jgi:hypothetical protein
MATGLHEKGPVLQFRFVLIVGSAAELDVVGVVRAASCVRYPGVKLDLPSGRATAAFGVDESASPLISVEHLPASLGGNRAGLATALLLSSVRPVRERRLPLFRFG